MKPAIRVEHISKRYRVGAGPKVAATLTESIRGAARRAVNRLRRTPPDDENTFWALTDVSFEVQPGEVVGVIGRNGAGKSTLLKVLSRIVEPTSGRAEVRGRLGSLLEVGTGFHPELTGRENIYLNGSLLGMTRREIDRSFDEIVAFSEIEKFLDTPVKRYSSGMYVRLAFAVAAHLEPEILIVDEVLAVGDAQFQQKCMGKMSSVARHGRTILFVSHNMAAVRTLCSRGIVLNKGKVELVASAADAVEHYFATNNALRGEAAWELADAPQGNDVALRRVWLSDDRGSPAASIDFRDPFTLNVEYEQAASLRGVRIGIEVKSSDGTVVFGSSDYGPHTTETRPAGRYVSRCRVPGHTLNSGTYAVTVGSDQPSRGMSFLEEGCVQLVVTDGEGHGPGAQRPPGVARPAVRWEVGP